AVFRLTDHMKRLRNSARIHLMACPYSVDELVEAAKDVVRENGMDSCYIRPLMWLGFGEIGLNPLNCEVHAAIACWAWGPYLGDEVFFTGTAAELVPIREIDDRAIGDSVPGPVTKQLQERFFDAVHGRAAEYDHWLEFVK